MRNKDELVIRPTGVENGQYYSWIIESDNLAKKKTDKSVFEHHGSGVPKEIRWFFKSEDLTIDDRLDITLIYKNKEYKAYIKKESSLGRTRMFWSSDLSQLFKEYLSKIDAFPILIFERNGSTKYNIRFEDESKTLIEKPLDDSHSKEEQEEHASQMNIDSLKLAAKSHSKKVPVEKEVTIKQVTRDPYVAEYAKKRANGICQLCGEYAPFIDSKGKPYLESHHIIWIAKGGEDSISNTVALCPNCHRKMHVVASQDDIDFLIRNALDEDD